MNWGQIVLTLVPVLGTLLFLWKKTSKILLALGELGEALSVIAQAGEDGKITGDEAQKIWKEVSDVLAVFKKSTE